MKKSKNDKFKRMKQNAKNNYKRIILNFKKLKL